jgi:hypothetical protein
VTPAEIDAVPLGRRTSERRESAAKPSVLFTVNACTAWDAWPWSSVARTTSCQRPSAGATGGGGGAVGSAGGGGSGGKATSYAPGVFGASVSAKATEPSGAVSVAVTTEGRTTL